MSSIIQTICERRTYSNIKHTHSHDYSQLLLPLQGCLHVGTARKEFALKDERLLFLPPNCEHTYYSLDKNEFVVLDIPQQLFPNLKLPDQASNEIFIPIDEHWQAIRTLLIYEAEKGQNGRINDLMHYITRFLNDYQIPPSIQYIHDHYDQNISIETLAKLEHYQVSYYSQWFKQKFGMTPKNYIQMIRLKKAKQLLVETDLSLLSIANHVGYEFQSSLTRLFLQNEQLSPQQFRKKYRK